MSQKANVTLSQITGSFLVSFLSGVPLHLPCPLAAGRQDPLVSARPAPASPPLMLQPSFQHTHLQDQSISRVYSVDVHSAEHNPVGVQVFRRMLHSRITALHNQRPQPSPFGGWVLRQDSPFLMFTLHYCFPYVGRGDSNTSCSCFGSRFGTASSGSHALLPHPCGPRGAAGWRT